MDTSTPPMKLTLNCSPDDFLTEMLLFESPIYRKIKLEHQKI